MKLKKLFVLLAAAGLSLQAVPAQNSTNVELNALVREVSLKIKDGIKTESALAPQLAQFDALLAAEKGAKSDEAARIIYMKGMLYLQVFENSDKAGELMKNLADNYAGTKYAESAAKIAVQIAQRGAAGKTQSALAPGNMFPDFSEKDLSGKALSVGAFKGKVVLVDFWATWCGPCLAELPNVRETYKKFHAQGFEIIGVSLDGSRARLESFLKENNDMKWPQFFEAATDGSLQNWGNKLALKYGVQGIPFTVLVGPDGKIIATDLRGEKLGAAVAKALGK